MATETQRTRLRADIGANEISLPATEADDIFLEAADSYTDTAAIHAQARVIAIRRLLANSAKLTTYRQNQSSENASDVFKHLKELLELWQGRLDKIEEGLAKTGQSVVRFGRPRRIPRHIKEYPGS